MKAKVTIFGGIHNLIEYSFGSAIKAGYLSMEKNVRLSAFARSGEALFSCLFSVSFF